MRFHAYNISQNISYYLLKPQFQKRFREVDPITFEEKKTAFRFWVSAQFVLLEMFAGIAFPLNELPVFRASTEQPLLFWKTARALYIYSREIRFLFCLIMSRNTPISSDFRYCDESTKIWNSWSFWEIYEPLLLKDIVSSPNPSKRCRCSAWKKLTQIFTFRGS